MGSTGLFKCEIELIMQFGAIIRVSELLLKSDRFFKTIKNVIPVLNEYDKLKHDKITRESEKVTIVRGIL